MPIFDSAKGDVPYNFLPNSVAVQAGSSSAAMRATGNVNVQQSPAGTSPGATGADNVLAVYSLPASFFDVANRELVISALGSFAANAHTKELKIFAGCTAAVVGSTVSGGTAIADGGAVTTSGGGWSISAKLFKYGAAGSNTQLAVQTGPGTLSAPQLLTLPENAPILIAVTGNATTTASDIVFNALTVECFN
jgi:hypothetical protein